LEKSSDSFSHHHGRLHTLRLQHLQGDPVGLARGVASIAHALRKNRGLAALQINAVHIDVGTAHAFSDGLTGNEGLTQLECHRCMLDDESVGIIATGLEVRSCVFA